MIVDRHPALLHLYRSSALVRAALDHATRAGMTDEQALAFALVEVGTSREKMIADRVDELRGSRPGEKWARDMSAHLEEMDRRAVAACPRCRGDARIDEDCARSRRLGGAPYIGDATAPLRIPRETLRELGDEQTRAVGAAAAQDWLERKACRCGSFHHTFADRDDGTCRYCGEPESYIAHRPPCLAREGPRS